MTSSKYVLLNLQKIFTRKALNTVKAFYFVGQKFRPRNKMFSQYLCTNKHH